MGVDREILKPPFYHSFNFFLLFSFEFFVFYFTYFLKYSISSVSLLSFERIKQISSRKPTLLSISKMWING
jgi:hypothetical protein